MAQQGPASTIVRVQGRELTFGQFLLAIAVAGVPFAIIIAVTHSRVAVQVLGFGLPVILVVTSLASGYASVHDVTSASWPTAWRIVFYLAISLLGLLLLLLCLYPLLLPWAQRPEDACFCLDAVRLTNLLGLAFGMAGLSVIQALLLALLASSCWNIAQMLRR